MAVYVYECINKKGETIKGKLPAGNEYSAAQKLKTMGFNVIGIKQEKQKIGSSFFTLSPDKKVTEGDLSLLARQLSAMLSSGIPVTRALFTIASQQKNNMLKKSLIDISRNVEGGMNLTDAFSAYPKIFPQVFCSMIEAGELGGMLDEALERLSDQLEKEKKLKDSIKSATFYPKMVLGFALIVVIAMMFFLVPMFQGFIKVDDPNDIPKVTRIIFSFSESVRTKWYLYIIAVIALIVILNAIKGTEYGKRFFARLKFKVPAFGPLNKKATIAKFCRTLSTLLDGGIPVVQALESAGPTSGSYIVSEAVHKAAVNIEQGRKISEEFEETDIFEPMVIHMVSVGEETGQLPQLLGRVATFYENEVETMTKGLAAMIEPLMLIIVGLVVGGMVIALYLPIFTAVTNSV